MPKFQNMENSNSRTLKDLLCFQGPGIFFQKFKDFQGLLKDPMNPGRGSQPLHQPLPLAMASGSVLLQWAQ